MLYAVIRMQFGDALRNVMAIGLASYAIFHIHTNFANRLRSAQSTHFAFSFVLSFITDAVRMLAQCPKFWLWLLKYSLFVEEPQSIQFSLVSFKRRDELISNRKLREFKLSKHIRIRNAVSWISWMNDKNECHQWTRDSDANPLAFRLKTNNSFEFPVERLKSNEV